MVKAKLRPGRYQNSDIPMELFAYAVHDEPDLAIGSLEQLQNVIAEQLPASLFRRAYIFDLGFRRLLFSYPTSAASLDCTAPSDLLSAVLSSTGRHVDRRLGRAHAALPVIHRTETAGSDRCGSRADAAVARNHSLWHRVFGSAPSRANALRAYHSRDDGPVPRDLRRAGSILSLALPAPPGRTHWKDARSGAELAADAARDRGHHLARLIVLEGPLQSDLRSTFTLADPTQCRRGRTAAIEFGDIRQADDADERAVVLDTHDS